MEPVKEESYKEQSERKYHEYCRELRRSIGSGLDMFLSFPQICKFAVEHHATLDNPFLVFDSLKENRSLDFVHVNEYVLGLLHLCIQEEEDTKTKNKPRKRSHEGSSSSLLNETGDTMNALSKFKHFLRHNKCLSHVYVDCTAYPDLVAGLLDNVHDLKWRTSNFELTACSQALLNAMSQSNKIGSLTLRHGFDARKWGVELGYAIVGNQSLRHIFVDCGGDWKWFVPVVRAIVWNHPTIQGVAFRRGFGSPALWRTMISMIEDPKSDTNLPRLKINTEKGSCEFMFSAEEGQSSASNLKSIEFSCENELLEEVVASCSHIKEVSLEVNQEAAGTKILDALVNMQSLKYVYLYRWDESTAVKSLINLISNIQVLKVLILDGWTLGNEFKELLPAVSNSKSFQKLKLRRWDFAPDGQKSLVPSYLGEMISNRLTGRPSNEPSNTSSCLLELCVHDFNLNDEDWVPLAKALEHNVMLNRLELKKVGMGDETMKALAHSLTINTTLLVLDISSNKQITAKVGMQAFIDELHLMKGLQKFFFEKSSRSSMVKQLTSKVEHNMVLHTLLPHHMGMLTCLERYWLDLNWRRRLLHHDHDIASGVWAFVLARAGRRREGESDIGLIRSLYFMVRERPDLYMRMADMSPKSS